MISFGCRSQIEVITQKIAGRFKKIVNKTTDNSEVSYIKKAASLTYVPISIIHGIILSNKDIKAIEVITTMVLFA